MKKRKPSTVRKFTQVLDPAPPPAVFIHFFQCVRREQRVSPHKKLGFHAHSLFGLMHHTFFAVWGPASQMIYSSQSLVIWCSPEKQELVGSNTHWLRWAKKKQEKEKKISPSSQKPDSISLSELIAIPRSRKVYWPPWLRSADLAVYPTAEHR